MTRTTERVPDFNPAVGAPLAHQHQPPPQQIPSLQSLAQTCTSTLSAAAKVPSASDGIQVEIQPYNPQWAVAFEEEANQIKAILGPDIVLQIYHIGSTSVPGLPAKPIIDMIPVVKNILAMDSPICRSKMEALGYEYKGELGIPFRRYYTKVDSSPFALERRTHHLHVYQVGNPEIEHHMQFRNYLSSNQAQNNNDFRKYAQLKMELAIMNPNDMRTYSLGKSNFINSLQPKIGFNGILLRNCETQEEWIGYRRLMRRSQTNGNEMDEKLPTHYQFVLVYVGQIVCAAHVILDIAHEYFRILDIQADDQWVGHIEQKMEQLLIEWHSHQQYLAKMEAERNMDLGRHFSGMNLTSQQGRQFT
jgi:GrpB-like predicted nucleotidyltransferase (UPF0157 family)